MVDTGQLRIDSEAPSPAESEAEPKGDTSHGTGRAERPSGTFASPSEGVRFGDYVVERVIGTAGSAEVVKAYHSADPDRPVALKRLRADLRDQAERVAMFRDEATLARRLRHSHIVEALDVGEVEGVPYIAFEHVEGLSLGALLRALRARDEVLPVGIACHVAEGLLLGLSYAHELSDEAGEALRVVHRDVTPENVLLAVGGAVKLTDFGFASSASHAVQTQAGIVKGTTPYLSPEQTHARPVDARSDIWSAGVVLYEMLAGERLFPGDDAETTIAAIRCAEMPALAPERVPPELAAIVERALRLEPEDRFEDAAAMREALVRFQRDAEQSAGQGELARLVRRFLPRQPAAAAGDTEDDAAEGDEDGLDAFEDIAPVSTVSAMLEPAAPARARTDELAAGEEEFAAVDDAELQAVEDANGLSSDVKAMGATETDIEDAGRDATESAGEAENANETETGITPRLRAAEAEADDDEPTRVRPMPLSWVKHGSLPAPAPSAGTPGIPSPFPAAGSSPSAGPHLDAPSSRRGRDDETQRNLGQARPADDSRGLPARGLSWLAAADQRLVLAAALAVAAAVVTALLAWPSNEPAVIQLSTSPADANVLLDGVTVSTASPHILSSVEPRKQHVLAVQKRGYRGWHTVLRLTPGQVLTLPEVALSPTEEEAALHAEPQR